MQFPAGHRVVLVRPVFLYGSREIPGTGQETVTWKEAVAVMERMPTLVHELMVKTPVMVADPADTPVTLHQNVEGVSASTVATEGSLLLQLAERTLFSWELQLR